jgi:GxxExxY protein
MSEFEKIPDSTERVASLAIEAAFRVHRQLGPGLLESVYETCLCHELTKLGVGFQRQLVLPVIYDEIRIDAGLRLDLLVDNCVIVELKAVESLLPIHEAQLLTYLKLSQHRLGLLINFNSVRLKDGLKRIAC